MITNIEGMARQLDEARRSGIATPQLTVTREVDLADAYDIQRAGLQMRRDAGEKVIGLKLGFTSKAKAIQMGVDDVIIGELTDAMSIPNGGEIDIGLRIHPRVEPEVAFRLNRDVDPHGSVQALYEAIGAVAPALEIIDSRYRDFKFSLADVVADNTSASAFSIGPWREWTDGDRLVLADRSVQLIVDGDSVATGSTTDILGDPWEALPATMRMAARYNYKLNSNSIILAGAATAAVALQPGTSIMANIDGLGQVSVMVQGKEP